MSMNRAEQGTADDGTIIPDPGARRRAVRDAITAQQAKKPRVNAQGHPLGYDQQSDEYRAAVPRAEHDRAHGDGASRDHSYLRGDG